ncbi:hypothetical protein DFH07DRAFT_1062912 [Mycena maculata]|uniref:Uncharacterized protein n=1 Tax=Mycena maculata TaxID=230809 RepID=A0AAD7IMR6_9AGAR|nr:hypothetical protein DFH07DRAFT_1062912 [Mycena maculata]
MRMMSTSAQDMHSRCSKCKVDPTVDQADKEKVWTPWYLTRHEEQFHSVEMQLARWYKKHATCLLCALDGCPAQLPRQSYTRHINPANGYHVGDQRLPQAVEYVVALPSNFLSDEELVAEEERWAREFANLTLPSNFLSDEELVAEEERWAREFANLTLPSNFLSDEELVAEEERWAREFANLTLPSSFLQEPAMVVDHKAVLEA